MKLHRAVVLVVMMLIGVGVFALLTAGAVATFDSHSLIALVVVLVVAAISGVAFSWNRYFSRGRQASPVEPPPSHTVPGGVWRNALGDGRSESGLPPPSV
jgi:protein-S-isoprenylcysteine O-methyltransferase Ste14